MDDTTTIALCSAFAAIGVVAVARLSRHLTQPVDEALSDYSEPHPLTDAEMLDICRCLEGVGCERGAGDVPTVFHEKRDTL